ncbi:hypothetical protein LA635_3290 [Erwinia amylovora LA635]|nr:hypothetical protein BEI72_09940 [Erwinia amylovora]CDK16914.1 hypothetical protein LA635_3290 [Erwinia amylovora LA635]CDK20282.1 hypothetical protein LA636_3290 [Erwinia amylovora LA636]CDK23653.1 hypothetical protein LA637_3293 [Erwinia amylovora LA637]
MTIRFISAELWLALLPDTECHSRSQTDFRTGTRRLLNQHIYKGVKVILSRQLFTCWQYHAALYSMMAICALRCLLYYFF